MDQLLKKGFVRINGQIWANTLVVFAFFGMQDYLTDVWKLSFTHAAAILNIWGGICRILPVFGLFLADTVAGRFKMIVMSIITNCVGLCLVTMSTLPLTGTCKHYEPECIGYAQKVIFYTGMALMAVGKGGCYASLIPFLEDQNEDHNNYERLRIMSLITVAFVPIIGFFAFPYIKQWFLVFGVAAICMVLATLLFLSGSREYTKVGPQGSPLTDVCRVFVVAAFKVSEPNPADTCNKDSGCFFRCLEKAAIKPPEIDREEDYGRKHCSEEDVEAAKITVRMVPMWMTFIICVTVSSVGNTYFVEHMNRKLGKWKVPSQLLLVLFFLGKWLFSQLAGCLVRGSKTYGPPTGIAVGMIFSVLACIAAAGIEVQRLKVVKRHELMSAYWLSFPFFLLAGLDSFFGKCVDAFYCNESPRPGMEPYFINSAKAVSGLGYMGSVLSVYVVGRISEIGGRNNWFQHNLNQSRLDRYYWVLAGLSSVNLLVFIVVASRYKYKKQVPDHDGDNELG